MNKSEPEKSAANRLAQAIERWEGEGGATQRFAAEGCDAPSALAEEERRILLCLGAAVIMQWNSLPTNIQRELFESAVTAADFRHSGGLKEHIARFLHLHKDDEQSSR
jgi:hypothetical protein